MKCPICGNKLEIKNKQIGTDNSGDPVFNEYAVCRDCKKQWNLDKQRAKKAAAKAARWQEIAKSAAKQSKRSRIPVVREPVNYREAIALAGELDVVLLPYENERGMAATREVMERISPGQSVGIFIGPEGGFDPSEIALAKEEGMHLVSLGKRILRTETAGLATLSILMYHIESVSEAEEERDQP